MRRALLVTEVAEPNPRLLHAVRWAHAHTDRPPVLATLSHPGGSGIAHAHRAGVVHFGLGPSGAPSLEAGLSGLCGALGISEVIVWDAPRTIGALRALRDLPTPPTVTAHIAPAAAVPWDELNIMAIRGRNVIDCYVTEDERSAEELGRFRLGRHVRLVTADARPPDGPEARTPDSLTVVVGATWRREGHTSPRLPASPAVSVRAFSEVMWDLVGGSLPTGAFAFPDPDLASAAPVEALREIGCRVSVSGGGIEELLTRTGVAEAFGEWSR